MLLINIRTDISIVQDADALLEKLSAVLVISTTGNPE
jgi:hypothetical protein